MSKRVKLLKSSVNSLREHLTKTTEALTALTIKYKNLEKEFSSSKERLSKYTISSIKSFKISFLSDFVNYFENFYLLLNSNTLQDSDRDVFISFIDQVESFFKSFGLLRLFPLNEQFDPVYHNAIKTISDTSIQNNFVVSVLRAGYVFDKSVIRPADVIVNIL